MYDNLYTNVKYMLHWLWVADDKRDCPLLTESYIMYLKKMNISHHFCIDYSRSWPVVIHFYTDNNNEALIFKRFLKTLLILKVIICNNPE